MSAPTPVILTEMELDALTELVNLGVSNAAHSLRELVREEILLSVPKVTVVSREEAIKNLGERDAKRLVAVHQDFEGDIAGRALLIFPETKSLELVRAIVGSDLSLDEIIELEQEALAETGNIILNGCLATMANQLQRTLRISLPEILHGASDELFNLPPPPDHACDSGSVTDASGPAPSGHGMLSSEPRPKGVVSGRLLEHRPKPEIIASPLVQDSSE